MCSSVPVKLLTKTITDVANLKQRSSNFCITDMDSDFVRRINLSKNVKNFWQIFNVISRVIVTY